MSTLDGYLMVVIIALAVWLTILYSWRFRVRLHNDSVASAEYCRGYDAGRAATKAVDREAVPQTGAHLLSPGQVVKYPPGSLQLAEMIMKNARAIEILSKRIDERDEKDGRDYQAIGASMSTLTNNNGVLYNKIDRLRERMHAVENMKDTVGTLVNERSGILAKLARLEDDHMRMGGELRACLAAITKNDDAISNLRERADTHRVVIDQLSARMAQP